MGEKAKSSWTHLDDSASEWRSLWDGVSSHLAAPLRRGSLFPRRHLRPMSPPGLTERTTEMESNQHPALLEREDCALVAWYPSLYAPSRGRGV
jgi:hypothetical protein